MPFINPLNIVFLETGCFSINLLTEAVIPAKILSKQVVGNGSTSYKVYLRAFKKNTSTASISCEC